MMKRLIREDTIAMSVMVIASITGVGFSSGQEMYQFFIRFGWPSLVSLLLFPVLIGFLSFAFMYISKKKQTDDYVSVIVSFDSKPIKQMVDLVVTFFISAIVISMIAASGIIVKQLFGFPTIIGSVFCTILLITAVLAKNMTVVSRFMQVVVPLFVVGVIAVCIASFSLPEHAAGGVAVGSNLIENWVVYGLIYISYNMLIIIGVLASLRGRLKTGRQIVFCAAFPTLVLFLLLLLQFLAIIRQTGISDIGVLPMAQVGKLVSPVIFYIYQVLLLLAACCASISCFFSSFYRIVRIGFVSHIRHWVTTVVLAVLFCVASQIGFVNIVSYVYPFIGFLGCFIMVFLVVSFVRTFRDEKKKGLAVKPVEKTE